MGAKKSKNNQPIGSLELVDSDYRFLIEQTGSTKEAIKAIFDRFNQDNPDGKLDKQEFGRLYKSLR
jgi:hypothetical protein